MARHLQNSGSDPTEVTLTNNVARTPSTTQPTHVTVCVDYNTLAAVTERTGTVTIGALALACPIVIRNFDGLTARRMSAFISFTVPLNKAYTVNMSSATNLTLTAVETPL